MMPNSGKRARGKRAVTEMETASVIHHNIIQEATANTGSRLAENKVPGQAKIAMHSNGPNTKPSFLYAPKVFTQPKLLKFVSLLLWLFHEIVCVVNTL